MRASTCCGWESCITPSPGWFWRRPFSLLLGLRKVCYNCFHYPVASRTIVWYCVIKTGRMRYSSPLAASTLACRLATGQHCRCQDAGPSRPAVWRFVTHALCDIDGGKLDMLPSAVSTRVLQACGGAALLLSRRWCYLPRCQAQRSGRRWLSWKQRSAAPCELRGHVGARGCFSQLAYRGRILSGFCACTITASCIVVPSCRQRQQPVKLVL